MASSRVLPKVPAKHADFISYAHAHADQSLPELLEPYKQYDASIREVFAQEPDHPALTDDHLNIVPVYAGFEDKVKIRARDPATQSDEERERYVMPLDDADRRPTGSPAIAKSIDEFKQNFSIFCEQSLADLNWSNVVAAGSAVVTSLLPVPDEYKSSKRALRQYYHEILAPASDVDLFIYGLSEEDAVKKILEIEQCVKDSILTEITTVRTKNAITIASQYPTRHIQIVLRIYKSVAEILTGFDVDCSCAAYDGKQVWAAPRALTAYMSQINTIDLTRRSPSYENRLSKYSHRGFEVYWPLLERSRVDPTIFERHFGRTVGLARLLVLERLPSKTEREDYMDERRRERGRPAINRNTYYNAGDNIKEAHEDEVAEWVEQEDVSNYHTFTIPYGKKYHAKKIEKLLYAKDILLNAEWNKKKDREVNLHRHPAFFGYAKDVIHDCCGFCPEPVTPEEKEAAEEEGKIYVSGEVTFIKDDPGRQAIGSFNPITDDDWTEMAYVGNTARLCQAIVDQDLEHVQDWLAQEGSDPNCRDYTGRTPLHLAVMSSSPEIVQALIDHDARLVARLADGRTALHLAAARGNAEIVRMIMQRSEKNEEEESKKEDIRKQTRKSTEQKPEKENDSHTDEGDQSKKPTPEDEDVDMADQSDEADAEADSMQDDGGDEDWEKADHDEDEDEDENGDQDQYAMSNDEANSRTTGSFVKVEKETPGGNDAIPEENEDDPDVYDVNVLAWDLQCSPLHLAILHGHTDVVIELVQNFGADVLLPIKLYNEYDKSPRGAILTLVLALSLPLDKAKSMVKTLLDLGASSAQADTNQITALHYMTCGKTEILDTLFEVDEPAAKKAINHLTAPKGYYTDTAYNVLMSATWKKDIFAARKLLEKGAAPTVQFKDWIKAVSVHREDHYHNSSAKENKREFRLEFQQPIQVAIEYELPEIASQLIDLGADPNTLSQEACYNVEHERKYEDSATMLDLVRRKIRLLEKYKDEEPPKKPKLNIEENVDYLAGIEKDTYAYFAATKQIKEAQKRDEYEKDSYEQVLKRHEEYKAAREKKKAEIGELLSKFRAFEQSLLNQGAKTFQQLHPKLYRAPPKEEEDDDDDQSMGGEGSSFAVEISFDVHDLEEETREGYAKLFQAVWDNDLDTVKALTLSPWGADNRPLEVAVTDSVDCSTFAIAVMRGHLDLAQALVEISYAQYDPKINDRPNLYRYRLGAQDNSDSDSDSDSDIELEEEATDEEFTVNIGEAVTETRSGTSPLGFMGSYFPVNHYTSLFLPAKSHFTYGTEGIQRPMEEKQDMEAYAIATNDASLFAFMVDLKTKWTELTQQKAGESPQIVSFDAFPMAMVCGRTEFMEEMIRRGGAGMELESLVKRSGVQLQEKPKYYQGLSIHGKKRSDWIAAARGESVATVSETRPPLLMAAYEGSLRSVEWFLSDTPCRRYLEFAEANKDHKFIAHLNKDGGGFEKVLKKWLNARNELALHCAVIAKPTAETSKIIKYLIEVMPKSLDSKSADGRTPLAIAFQGRRLDAAKILVEAGADQSTRTKEGCNILHLLLPSFDSTDDFSDLKSFLDLIDKRLLPSLLTERSWRDPGSLTPIISYMRFSSFQTHAQEAEMLRFLLTYAAESTNNEHLELLDATGDTPLHYLVKEKQQHLIPVVLESRPDLLFRENSVGRTPYELAEDIFVSSNVSNAPSVGKPNRWSNDALEDKPVDDFKEDKEEEPTAESIWRLCKEWLSKIRGDGSGEGGKEKRVLVSLEEANEVAKRLAARKRRAARTNTYEHRDDENDGDDDENDDEVTVLTRYW
ncbi:unnamed protein product [Periconia digitata]|uniref:Ankyrin repeat protein n=1 Tax=Periconia digitata TaxID=1303443 RepID=A0A9W4XR83_9PLEO|nr:unnamed protein product [Periconia digitata]